MRLVLRSACRQGWREVGYGVVESSVDSGNVMGAQKVILKELESEFGGAAKAMNDPAKQAAQAWHHFEEELGLKVLPVVEKGASVFANDLLPAVQATGEVLGPLAHALNELPGPLKEGLVLLAGWKLAALGLRETRLAGFFTSNGVAVVRPVPSSARMSGFLTNSRSISSVFLSFCTAKVRGR